MKCEMCGKEANDSLCADCAAILAEVEEYLGEMVAMQAE